MATGRRPARSLAEHLHRHLISRCPECRAAWDALGEGRQTILAMLDRELAADVASGRPAFERHPSPRGPSPRGPSTRGPSPRGSSFARRSAAVPAAAPAPRAAADGGDSPYGSAFGRVMRRVDEEAARLHTRRRRAERDLRALLAVPAADRAKKVLNARTRYRSRAFAERLLEEARDRMRTDPREAAGLAELVPLVVLWTPGALPSPWGDELVIRARAWHANALRVAGDLQRAEHELATLRRELTGRPLDDEVAGELDSLEASLRLDQGRFPEAGACLDRAVRSLAGAGRPEAWARALVKRGELHRLLGHSAQALEDARAAQAHLDPRRDTVSYLCAVGNQVLALCDLDRPQEARRLLDENAPVWQGTREDWWLLRLDVYTGRIRFGLGDLAAAEASFRTVLQRCRDLELPYEAAMAAIDLSMALLAQGRTREVRELAREAAPAFVDRNLHRESLAALALFQNAAQAETLTLASARRLRQYLNRSHQRPHPAADG